MSLARFGLPAFDISLGQWRNEHEGDNDQPLAPLDHLNLFRQKYNQLNEAQHSTCDEIIESLQDENSKHDKVHFIDGPGGSGKTFLFEVKLEFID
jgi:hypothetical protein